MPDTGDQNVNNDSMRPIDDFPDRSVFEQPLTLPALDVPVTQTAHLRKALSHVLWRRPRMQNVWKSPTDDRRRLLLLKNEAALQDAMVQELLQTKSTGEDDSTTCHATTHKLTLTYDDLSVEEVLRQLLPKDQVKEIPSAYESVGTIAHVNLPADCRPYQYWIGKVLLDKNQPQVKTVVNKLSSINDDENPFRTFAMHVIAGHAGDGWSRVTVREEGCVYHLDFCKVYWNSRLAGEHRRLVRVLQQDAATRHKQHDGAKTVVVDLMAGVGPFAIPLTRPPKRPKQPKGGRQSQPQVVEPPKIVIYANDLNPASFRFLEQNAAANNCQDLHCSNLDARALVHQLQKDDDTKTVHHFVLNLPASAPEFLDAFRGYRTAGDSGKDEEQKEASLPMLHVYCFAPKRIVKQDGDDKANATTDDTDGIHDAVYTRCERAMGCPMDRSSAKIHVVRDVAPNKNMLCVSFRLPAAVRELSPVVVNATCDDGSPCRIGEAAASTERPTDKESPERKRPKTEDES